MPIEPLDETEKAYFDTILNGGRPDGGVELTLIRMQTLEGDPNDAALLEKVIAHWQAVGK